MSLPATTVPAISDAVAAPPNEPPTVRVTVFIPVATPVSAGPTFSMIRFAIAANASPTPLPSRAPATNTSHFWSCANAITRNDSNASAAPVSSGGFEPNRFSSRPVCEPTMSIAVVEGSMNRPAPVTDASNP